MKIIVSLSVLITLCVNVFAQKEFHVFTDGSSQGNGTLLQPWDLQTALNQSSNVINGGDTIWIHQGVYNGKFSSVLQSTITNLHIIVSAYKNDKVVLNGNVASNANYVLEVKGANVIYKN